MNEMNETTKKEKYKATEADNKAKAIFATSADRDAVKPDCPAYKKATIKKGKDGSELFTYTDGYASGYTQLGKHLGYTISIESPEKQVDKMAVARNLSDDELKQLLAERKAAKKAAAEANAA